MRMNGVLVSVRTPRRVRGADAAKKSNHFSGGVLNLFMEDFPHPPALVGGVLAEDCRRVLTDFFRNLR